MPLPHELTRCPAMKHPLLLGDLASLKAKLEGANGLLGSYWREFRETMMADPATRSNLIFLPALFDDALLPEARALLQDYWRSLLVGDTANDFQFHTWCRCGSVLRRLAFVDWLAARDAWSAEELDEAAEAFLGFAFKHPFWVLQGRERSSNNQPWAMLLYCAMAGFLFGYKHGNHATGRFLFDYAIGRLPDLIGLFPADGYAGEGSTYTSHVNTPLACWTADFLHQVTGNDYTKTHFAPNGTTLDRLIDIERCLLGSDGLLAPWDHYGWQEATNASPFAYLAGIRSDPAYLSLIPALHIWGDPGMLAWGADDPMWTLIWWPAAFADWEERQLPPQLFGWHLPRTGASLDDPGRQFRLMQVWDASSATIAGLGRAQVNPNHLMLSVAGEPVFQDGVQEKGTDPWGFPPERVLSRLSERARERFIRYRVGCGAGETDLREVVSGIAPGLVGAANAIVIDDEPWYWPGERRIGKSVFYGRNDHLQAVISDSTAFYAPAYDVTCMQRASVLTDDGLATVVDRLSAQSAHSWTWQAYLRPSAALAGNQLTMPLPNGETVVIAWEDGLEAALRPVPHFPRTQEGHSALLTLKQRGQTATFAVAIALNAQAVTVACDGAAVVVRVDGDEHRFVADNTAQDTVPIARRDTRAPVAWLAPDAALTELNGPLNQCPAADIHALSDIAVDRDLQKPELAQLVAWQADPVPPAQDGLKGLDACLAALGRVDSDPEPLIAALGSGTWPVQAAAVEALGRLNVKLAAPTLREWLTREHARPEAELYPPGDAVPAGMSSEEAGKRWRLKAALICALGRLHDAEAVPLLGAILADGRDFYPVYSVTAQALGRIGGRAALEALAPALDETEINTYNRARAAKAAIEQDL